MKENQKIMASKESGSRKLKKSTLPKFEADVYSKVPPGDLIVFSVHYLMERRMKITLEDIVSICFQLFPLKFGLKKFRKWPDSAFVSRRWGDVRRKGYVAANTDLEYNLTSKGSNLVKKLEKILGISAPKPAAKLQPAQPKKEVLIPVKKTQTKVIKEKTTNPVKKVRKVKALSPKAPAVIQKKIEQLFQEEKVTPSAPIKKIRPIRAKKVSSAPALAKLAQRPEIKVRPALQPKKAQSVQTDNATPPAPTKKIRPIRAKKLPSVYVKQTQSPKVKARPAIQKKESQPVQEQKATLPAPAKKTHSTRAKKASPVPVKQVQTVQPVLTQVKKTQLIREEKAILPAPVKKIWSIRAKKVSLSLPPAKQVNAPEIKVQPAQKEKATTSAPVKKIRPIRAKKVSPAPVKQAQASETKVPPVTRVRKKSVIRISKPVEQAQPIHAVRAPTKITKPKQVKNTKPVWPTIVRPGKVGKTQPQKADFIAPINVTKEEKERAGKFARMMDRSDAYIHYKKNGSNSKINEFDFRSLLLCTMESSPETLARNVKLFKGYAGIHNRQDLITFLVFCEEKFSFLLKPQTKSIRKARK
jgi:hypothetical protein